MRQNDVLQNLSAPSLESTSISAFSCKLPRPSRRQYDITFFPSSEQFKVAMDPPNYLLAGHRHRFSFDRWIQLLSS